MAGDRIGPTGEFPSGRMNAQDEGSINIGVAAQKGKVVMAFGGAVTWLGMDPEHARAIAKSLEEKALLAEAQRETARGSTPPADEP